MIKITIFTLIIKVTIMHIYIYVYMYNIYTSSFIFICLTEYNWKKLQAHVYDRQQYRTQT